MNLRWRVAVLVVGDGLRALAGVLVPLAIVLAWIARSMPPPDLRAAILHAEARERSALLVGLLLAVAVASAPAVRVVLASQRLVLLRSLPLSHGWWQRRHALHLFLVDAPWWLAIGYVVAPLARAQAGMAALEIAIGGAGVLLALQVAAVAFADRGALVRWAVPIGVALVGGAVWAGGSAHAAALLGLVAGAWAITRLRRPPPEPRPRVAVGFRVRGPARAWMRLLAVVWMRRAATHCMLVSALQLGALAMVVVAMNAFATTPDDAAGWIGLLRGVGVGGALLGASAVLFSVRACDRDRWWFDASPLSTRDEHRGRALFAAVAAAPTLVLATVAAVVGGLGPLPVLEPAIATAWAIAVTLDLVAGREHARALHDAAWRRFALAAVAGETVALVVGPIALLPWMVVAERRARRRLADARATRRRFELGPKDDDHG